MSKLFVLNLLFPPRCLACRTFVKDDSVLCAVCEDQWPQQKTASCSQCAQPFESGDSHLCGLCLKEKRELSGLRAAALYQGVLLDLLKRLKYKGEERLAFHLGRRLQPCLADETADVVMPIPLHIGRLRDRGYNQSLLLANEVGYFLGRPVDAFSLKKERSTPPQAGLSLEERQKNIRGSFFVRTPEKVKGKKVLLVDDVYTTGATMEEGARALLKAGAKEVRGVVLARAV